MMFNQKKYEKQETVQFNNNFEMQPGDLQAPKPITFS